MKTFFNKYECLLTHRNLTPANATKEYERTKHEEKMERNIASKMPCEFSTFWDISLRNLFSEEAIDCKISSSSSSKKSLFQKNDIHYKSWLPVIRLVEMTLLECVWRIRENRWTTLWFSGSGRPSSLYLLPTSSSHPKTELEHEKWFVFTGAGNLFPSNFLLCHTQVPLSSRNLEPFTLSLGLSNHWHWSQTAFPKCPNWRRGTVRRVEEVSTRSFCLGLSKGLKNLTRKQSEKRRS